MGDPARVALLKTVVDVIEEDHLLQKTQEAGAVLVDGLKRLEVIYIWC